jgi:putative sugar O-methyltransferase
VEELILRIETALKMSIGFPDIGAPYGLRINDKLITMESPEHLYVAIRINDMIKMYLENIPMPKILEIGGGFGGTAYWILKLRNEAVKSYVIIDLPHVNILQGYFLCKVFGEKNVSLYGEDGKSLISIMPTFTISKYNNVNIVINEDSMPEMPENVVKDYVSWIKKSLIGIFYSYNQEAYSPVNGIPQVLVPKIIAETGGLEKFSRNCSWMHPGYVEEVYTNRHSK